MPGQEKISITTFYRFLPLPSETLPDAQKHLETLAKREHLRGLILLGTEGINATVSGPPGGLEQLKHEVRGLLRTDHVVFKDSVGNRHPFQVFKVKIKEEIVSLGKPHLVPTGPQNSHLSPREWQKAMEEPDTLVLDTRNGYEIEIGKFKNAQDLNLDEFNEFPQRLQESGLDKGKKVLLYCTGGIRCEKAILEMRHQGFESVFQLEGGILNYLKEFPEKDFEGECFVFDYRVAVDQHLQPTRNFKLCPHCGQPAKDQIRCGQCGRNEVICQHCRSQGTTTCSKNCAHHQAIGSASSKPHLPELKKRSRV